VPVWRAAPVETAISIDGKVADWPSHASVPGFDRLPVDMRYLARPDLLEGRTREAADPATARFTYDTEYVYIYIDCPQRAVDDQRTSQRPTVGRRWWGTDGIQVQIAGGAGLSPGTRVIDIAAKPSGIAMVRSATLVAGAGLIWTDGPTGLKWAVDTSDRGYSVELAIPRVWFTDEYGADKTLPLWRLNLLRHIGRTNQSMTWSGPVVDDEDIGMMGVVIGSPTDGLE